MKKIINESYQDIETYLRSSDLVTEIVDKFGESHEGYPYGEVVTFIVDEVRSRFGDDVKVKEEKVIICKVVNGEIDLLDTDHYVVNYNGIYYDYSACQFNDSFDSSISQNLLPVVQKIIHSDSQISDKLSTIKGYVILGY